MSAPYFKSEITCEYVPQREQINVKSPQTPNSLDTLLTNFKTVITNSNFSFGHDLDVLPLDKAPKLNYEEIITRTEDRFWKLLGDRKLGVGDLEYVPGRLTTRLERLAEVKYGMELSEAHEKMKTFVDKLIDNFKSNLPAETVWTNTLRIESDRDNLYVVMPSNEDAPPFYQESQRKINTCLLHSTHALLGKNQSSVKDLESVNNQQVNADETMFSNRQIQKLLKLNFSVVEFSLDSKINDYLIDLQSFKSSNGIHSFCYRKDKKGQWWKVDSLLKVGSVIYQVPVDLEQERRTKWADKCSIQYISKNPEDIVKKLQREAEYVDSKIKDLSLLDSKEVSKDLEKLKYKIECVFVLFDSQSFYLEDQSLARSLEEFQFEGEKSIIQQCYKILALFPKKKLIIFEEDGIIDFTKKTPSKKEDYKKVDMQKVAEELEKLKKFTNDLLMLLSLHNVAK